MINIARSQNKVFSCWISCSCHLQICKMICVCQLKYQHTMSNNKTWQVCLQQWHIPFLQHKAGAVSCIAGTVKNVCTIVEAVTVQYLWCPCGSCWKRLSVHLSSCCPLMRCLQTLYQPSYGRSVEPETTETWESVLRRSKPKGPKRLTGMMNPKQLHDYRLESSSISIDRSFFFISVRSTPLPVINKLQEETKVTCLKNSRRKKSDKYYVHHIKYTTATLILKSCSFSNIRLYTLLMLSCPPATTMLASPLRTAWAAMTTDLSPDPHSMLTLVAGTV